MTEQKPGRTAPAWAYSFSLHVVAGGIATAAHYAVMYVLLKGGMGGLAASSLGFVSGAITRFLLSYFHVFTPTSGVRRAMARFAVALSVQMAANSGLVALLLFAGLGVWWAQVLTTASLVVFTFIAGRLWVFR